MSGYTIVGLFILLTWMLVYTVSYGIWTWKKKNKLGAIMVFIVALASVGVPIFTIFFRQN